ncbi:hypothetical protein E2320_006262 [Naja naja]|nr:hypothetical protein E2320_006262 [Naja naja]
MATLPPELQKEKALWMEGTKLYCRQCSDPENSHTCITIDIAPSKPEVPETPTEGFIGRLSRCSICDDWKRVILLSVLIIILFCIILWPVQELEVPQQVAPGPAELCALPPHHPAPAPELQKEKALWMEGTKLYCRQCSDSENSHTCITIIAPSKPKSPRPQGFIDASPAARYAHWNAILLSVLIIILFCIILWPVQCIVKTGNLKCLNKFAYPRPNYVPYHLTTPPPTLDLTKFMA